MPVTRRSASHAAARHSTLSTLRGKMMKNIWKIYEKYEMKMKSLRNLWNSFQISWNPNWSASPGERKASDAPVSRFQSLQMKRHGKILRKEKRFNEISIYLVNLVWVLVSSRTWGHSQRGCIVATGLPEQMSPCRSPSLFWAPDSKHPHDCHTWWLSQPANPWRLEKTSIKTL